MSAFSVNFASAVNKFLKGWFSVMGVYEVLVYGTVVPMGLQPPSKDRNCVPEVVFTGRLTCLLKA